MCMRKWPGERMYLMHLYRVVLVFHLNCSVHYLPLLLCRLLAVVTAVFSAAIVLAEATISPYIPNLSVFSRALHETAGNELATEMLAFVFLVRWLPFSWVLLVAVILCNPLSICTI